MLSAFAKPFSDAFHDPLSREKMLCPYVQLIRFNYTYLLRDIRIAMSRAAQILRRFSACLPLPVFLLPFYSIPLTAKLCLTSDS